MDLDLDPRFLNPDQDLDTKFFLARVNREKEN